MHKPEKLEERLRNWQRTHAAPGCIRVISDPGECPRVVLESFRWGEAHIDWQDGEFLCMGIALSVNQEITGGVVLGDIEPDEDPAGLVSLRQLGERLRMDLEGWNRINRALMAERRAFQRAERSRAEGIHAWKIEQAGLLRQGFSLLEPELVLAIRRGDRAEARRVLNALLISVYNAGESRLDRVKDLLAELIYLMRGAARDCGVADADTPLLREPVAEGLARVEDEEELSPWVRRHLEGLLDAIAAVPVSPASLRARMVVSYIRENHARPLGRPEVARKAGLSESEFSRMLKRETGFSFTEHLLRARIDKAMLLLRSSPLTIQEIGFQCGFENAPHFSRTFKAMTGKSPSEFRTTNAQL